jgi:hypothetical protein
VIGKQGWKPDIQPQVTPVRDYKKQDSASSAMKADMNSDIDFGKFRKPSPDDKKIIMSKPVIKVKEKTPVNKDKSPAGGPKEMVRPH